VIESVAFEVFQFSGAVAKIEVVPNVELGPFEIMPSEEVETKS